MPIPLSMSVNMSCRQFAQPDLVHQVEQILMETGLDARRFRMEITETASSRMTLLFVSQVIMRNEMSGSTRTRVGWRALRS